MLGPDPEPRGRSDGCPMTDRSRPDERFVECGTDAPTRWTRDSTCRLDVGARGSVPGPASDVGPGGVAGPTA